VQSAGAAIANTDRPASGTAGVPGAPLTAHHANMADQYFAYEAALDALAELGAARVAASQAQSAHVKQFATRMLEENAKSREVLQAIAGADNVPVASTLDSAHQSAIQDLGRLQGQGFDLGYLRAEVASHQRTAQLYEWIIGSGQDPSVREYAAEALPAELQQLQTAQSLLVQLGTVSD
jgi:putative membrane protein